MKSNHDQEDCPCLGCFRHELMDQVLAYCADTETSVFEVVGMLDSMKFELLKTMSDAQDAEGLGASQN